MEGLVIDFKPNGSVASLHMDSFDLGFLGKKETYRQTDIRFNSDTQLWDLIYLADDGSQYADSRLEGFGTYENARLVEVDWLNTCRLFSIDPVSDGGLRIVAGIRKHG